MRTISRPHTLLDYVKKELGFRRDKDVAELLNVGISAISKIRKGANVSAEIILRIHEQTNIPISVIREKLSCLN